MTNIKLTDTEYLIFKNRGFYIKTLSISVLSIFIDTVILFIITSMVLLVSSIHPILHIDSFSILIGLMSILAAKGFYNYLVNNKIYFLKEFILVNGQWEGSKEGTVKVADSYSYIFPKLHRYITIVDKLKVSPFVFTGLSPLTRREDGLVIVLMCIVTFPILGIFFSTFPVMFISFIFAFIVPLLLRQFSSLFRFGKHAIAVQELTQTLINQGERVKINFEGNINFLQIRKDFQNFSQIFSRIISSLIHLEGLESKINKGNLFDSEKYISSLQSDIIEPLKSLKTFLEKQKEELLSSQKELRKIRATTPSLRDTPQEGNIEMRVRVGGLDPETPQGYFQDSLRESRGANSGGIELLGGQGHGELSSKRSEALLGELTENIGKLDEMIGKMG